MYSVDLTGRITCELEVLRRAKALRSFDLKIEGGLKNPPPELLGVFESDSDSELENWLVQCPVKRSIHENIANPPCPIGPVNSVLVRSFPSEDISCC